MPITLTVRDETAAGGALHELTLDFLTEQITVRELIRSRVYQEVKDFNVKAAQRGLDHKSFRGLVQPNETERTLNTAAPWRAREIDWKKQFEIATEAFEHNGFLILIDERQATKLDEEIVLAPGTQVSFVKLTPLVGG